MRLCDVLVVCSSCSHKTHRLVHDPCARTEKMESYRIVYPIVSVAFKKNVWSPWKLFFGWGVEGGLWREEDGRDAKVLATEDRTFEQVVCSDEYTFKNGYTIKKKE